MKHILLAFICVSLLSATFAQDNPRPTKSRFWKSKESTFAIKPGDILVYQVQDNGETYDLLVHVKSFGNSINFTYDVPQKNNRSAVMIEAAAVKDNTAYNNIFSTAGKGKSTLWLSKKNWRDIATVGATAMDFGNGSQQFTRVNNGTIKINYKGKPKILTLYNVTAEEGNKRSFGVLTEENNPLLVTADDGINFKLKEVR
ncbi:hypothetical protein [Aridibaculum aurantiacum]|uniref:hypothetical protein n=1 Tax=Aridibaculum aurantiacum TaxID=2810307 RepID=UPI001A9686A4|nr:hypothetical protein [Aridibaculum aurantiacum]